MPDSQQQITEGFAKLRDIVAKLRAPGGCPWDREQTNESLLPALIEEAYETAEASRAQDDAHFREELGDLLLLVVMHTQIACEAGRFSIEEVIEQVSDKLIRRHPHVFGTSEARDAGAVLKQWEAIKREEKNADLHYLASLPKALPALVRAQKAQSKAARVNFDWTTLLDVVAKDAAQHVTVEPLSLLDRSGRAAFDLARADEKPPPSPPLAAFLRLELPVPVSGPVVLGYGAHFGLGQFVSGGVV